MFSLKNYSTHPYICICVFIYSRHIIKVLSMYNGILMQMTKLRTCLFQTDRQFDKRVDISKKASMNKLVLNIL